MTGVGRLSCLRNRLRACGHRSQYGWGFLDGAQARMVQLTSNKDMGARFPVAGCAAASCCGSRSWNLWNEEDGGRGEGTASAPETWQTVYSVLSRSVWRLSERGPQTGGPPLSLSSVTSSLPFLLLPFSMNWTRRSLMPFRH